MGMTSYATTTVVKKGERAPNCEISSAIGIGPGGIPLLWAFFWRSHRHFPYNNAALVKRPREREKEKNRIRRNCTKEEEKAPFSSLFAAFLFRPITTHVGRCCCVVMLLGKKEKELYMLHVCGAFSSSLFLYSAVRRRRGISVRGRESGMTFTNYFQN